MANPTPPPTETPPDAAAPKPRRGLRREVQLPFFVVVLLHVVGWLLVVLGVLGLFLPVLQGVLLLTAGFAVLSIASQTFHGFLRERFRRYPRAWRQLERLRRALERRLHGATATTAGSEAADHAEPPGTPTDPPPPPRAQP
jgi:hypothetical protein